MNSQPFSLKLKLYKVHLLIREDKKAVGGIFISSVVKHRLSRIEFQKRAKKYLTSTTEEGRQDRSFRLLGTSRSEAEII